MRHHEKIAFLKFFITYFLSVALLIVVAGYFHFLQEKEFYLKKEEFSLIEYARYIKMGNNPKNYSKEYSHKFLKPQKKHINISNFIIKDNKFIKLIPIKHNERYMQVSKSKNNFNKKIYEIAKTIIIIQILLLILFAYISYILAKNALKPLQNSISTLDKFAKDLIHDLNTPVTSMKLNIQLIQEIPQLQNNNALLRLNKSINNISELHENLTILLQEKTFQMQEINLCESVHEVVEIQKQIHSNINFKLECSHFKVMLNPRAIKQILQNIISNACKYNIKDGYVYIYLKDTKLYIEDNGKGINEPHKIFNRFYSDEQGSGIGLDIVKRLSDAMNIDINVDVKDSGGSIFILTFLDEK